MWDNYYIKKRQLTSPLLEIIKEQNKRFHEELDFKTMNRIPHPNDIPTEQSDKWFEIEGVICVFIDMKSSTKLSHFHEGKGDKDRMVQNYTLFTGTAIKLLHYFKASAIDIKGDGVFGLFNYDQVHRALAAAVSFKTFADTVFYEEVSKKVKGNISTGARIGVRSRMIM